MVLKIPEPVKAAEKILEEYDIKPEIRRAGKHIQISWISPSSGKQRVYNASSTPSDRREIYNVKAGIKRMLREDNVEKPDPRSFHRAMSLPNVVQPTNNITTLDRVKKAEESLEALWELVSDWKPPFLDVLLQLGNKTYKLVETSSDKVIHEGERTTFIKRQRIIDHTKHPYLSMLTKNWVTLDEFVRRLGADSPGKEVVRQRLNYLVKKNLIEYAKHVGWRLKEKD